ncbi:VOC family protein [Novosphingobium olei]|uniref:Glyoxalase/bleomycin resistance/extradiol dioxygenase family protein n=1 Tax=Novosphingobium olei TaxID=2728851 RepID=A0A7Y0BSX1_9SPHN|nr:VOC family protein [Novosphingobium olei]NML95868.1 glyoxalase/bleomycin resistance/extradiol dioxygenase family protein [Novosphingobium olei]BEV02079.1 VOC family protein [Novosphingobium olei]
MQVNALDHVNIICADLDASAAFYAALLGLERRDGPPPSRPDQIQWMHDRQGRPILHLNSVDCPRAYDRAAVAGGETGAIHHVALNCSEPDVVLARLKDMGRDCQHNRIDSIGLTQVFTLDPNGVLLELNFWDGQ